MPYAPDIQYRGDQYAFQGISNLGNIVSEDLKKYLELKKQGALNDTIIQHAVQTKRITPEEYNNYTQANWTKKQSIANGLMANIADDWQRQMFARKEDKSAELANALAVANIHAASAAKVAQMNIDAGKYAGSGGDEPTQVDPLYEPTTKQPVPGYGIVRKTGAVVPTSTTVPDVILDPTKKFIYKGPKNGWQPLQSKLARQLGDATAGDAPMAPQGGFSLLHPSTWMGGPPTPTPAPTITPPDIPAAQGVAPGPAYPAAGPVVQTQQVDPATARAQAKAKIDAGADRDAIIARLKQLGVDSSGL